MKEIARGVNLGNWLVLERWMNEDLFKGLKANDETAFCLELGDKAAARLKAHRDSWITLEDFKWLKNAGINTLRIPIPHWIFGDYEPNIGCVEYLDNAVDWANQLGLKVLIDMHCAPGSQNGEHHSGLCGVMEWHQREEHIARTIDVMRKLSQRYKDEPCLWGMQLLNEPAPSLPHEILRNYYEQCYREIRKYVDENIAVVFHDQFNMHQWKDFMQTPEFKNVVMDVRVYQCFGDKAQLLSMHEQLNRQFEGWPQAFKELSAYFKIIVGEWSLGMYSKDASFANASAVQTDGFFRAFAGAQLIDYEDVDGYFFWSYKCDNPYWDYRQSVEKHYFPAVLGE